jgi:transporter family-2 protein
MYWALLAAALLIGCLLAVQASANQQLNRAVGTPYGASTLQLCLAAAVLTLLTAAVGKIGALGLVAEVQPWWLLLGGLASPLYITAGIVLFPRVGALTAVGLFVTGQVFASLALDLLGLLWVPRQPPTTGIVLGALAVLVGISVIIRGQRVTLAPTNPGPGAGPAAAAAPRAVDQPAARGGADSRAAAPATAGSGAGAAATATATSTASGSHPSVARPLWIALGLFAGAVLPFQGAINGGLRAEIGEPLAVGTISFIVATATIIVVLVVMLALRRTPRPRLAPLAVMPWWGWLGGFCALAYVTATFMLIPAIGAAVTVALTVTGQQLGSAVIDQYGLFRLPRRPLNAPRTVGLLLLVAGSVLVQFT